MKHCTGAEIILESELADYDLPDQPPILRFDDDDCLRLHSLGVSADDDTRDAQL